MIVLVATENYPQYVQYMKRKFPYFRPGPENDKHFCNIRPDNYEIAMSLERGSIYIEAIDEIRFQFPEWFQERFTRVLVADSVRHHSFLSSKEETDR